MITPDLYKQILIKTDQLQPELKKSAVPSTNIQKQDGWKCAHLPLLPVI